MLLSVKNKRVLFVGGAGFLGSWVINKITLHEPEKTFIIDNLFSGKMQNLTNAKHKVGKKVHYVIGYDVHHVARAIFLPFLEDASCSQKDSSNLA